MSDRGEVLSGLLPEEEAEALRSSSLEEFVSDAVEHLTDEERGSSSWAILFHVLGDQPPPLGLVEHIKEALSDIDLLKAVQEDAPAGLAVLRATSMQAVNLQDETVRSHLKNQLVSVAQHLAEVRRSDGVGEIDVRAAEQQIELRSLMESAVHLSAVVGNEGVYSDFAALLERLTDAWPAAASFCKLVTVRMCEELEATKAKHFWRVLNRLRAR